MTADQRTFEEVSKVELCQEVAVVAKHRVMAEVVAEMLPQLMIRSVLSKSRCLCRSMDGMSNFRERRSASGRRMTISHN